MSATDSMDSQTQTLYEAHVAFELDQWRGATAGQRLRDEVEGFWHWAEQHSLESVIDVAAVRAAAVRLALDIPVPDALGDVIAAIADDLLRLDINAETRVQDVIDENLFEDGVNLFIELEQLRNRLIKRVLDSPVYTALASDVLYQGIKDYIFSDTGAIKSIPGVSGFLKSSSNAISKRMPGLEEQVEKRVRAYIENNTAKTLARSEQLLLDSLDDARIRAIASEIWDAIQDQSLAIDDVVDTEELQKLVDYGLRVWQELRETEYIGQLVQAAVDAYFERYASRPISELLGHVGVDRQVLVQEADGIAAAVVEGLDATGLLEDIVRRRLAPFYNSEACKQALRNSAG